jgi:pyridoxal/pyridoxine/pyridoxamine kinase
MSGRLPNGFGLETLTGQAISSIDEAAEGLLGICFRYVIVSSVPTANLATLGDLLIST